MAADNWQDQYPEASPLDIALAHEGIDGDVADVARSIYHQESSAGKNTKTSNAGAVGGMQVIPATFKRVADEGWDINDPVDNARAGVRYIKALHERGGGDPMLTAVGYYGGEGAQDKARQGIAVADPRNPKAPNTLQYAQAVVDRMPKKPAEAPAPAADDWVKQYPEATDAEIKAAAPKPGTPATAPPRTTLQELGRQLGLTARAAAQGVVSLPAMASDAVTGVINKGLDAVEGEGNGFRFQRAQAALDNVMNHAGVPQPENATERVVQDVGSAMTGAGTAAKAGQVLAKVASPVAAAVGEKLAEGAGMQVASGAAGAGASGVTREEGGGTGAQIAAGLAGSLAPGFAAPAAKEGVRQILRGGEAGRQQTADNIARFEAAGTTPTLGQATEGRVARATESLLAKTPGGAGVIAKKAQQQVDDMSSAVQKLSDDLAPGASAVNAGEAIERGVKQFKEAFREQQRTVYDELDQHIPLDTRIPASNTQTTLASLNEDIKGSPALSKWFKNARIQGIEEALDSDMNGPAAVLSRPGMKEKADALRAQLTEEAQRAAAANERHVGDLALEAEQARQANEAWRNGLRQQAAQAQARNAERRALGMTNLEKVPTEKEINALPDPNPVRTAKDLQAINPPNVVRTPAQIEEEVTGFLQSHVDNKMPYESLKKLRTLVGKELEDGGLTADVPRSKWTALYAAISKDLGEAASSVSPRALQVWQRANDYTSLSLQRLDQLSKIVSRDAPEKVFAAAISGTNEGATTVTRVMKALPTQERNEVAAAVLQRLGRATPGQQNAGGDSFSAETFLTNLSKMSQAARQSIFGRTSNKDLVDRVQQLAKVSESRREGGKVFANPSGTAAAGAQQALNIGGTLGALGGMATGNFLPLAGALAVPAAANAAARIVTNPSFVRQIAKPTTLAPGAKAAAVEAAGRVGAHGTAAAPIQPAATLPAAAGGQPAPATQPASQGQPVPTKARIQALRDAGENDVADALEGRERQAQLLQAADQEVGALAQSSHPLFHMPEFADAYRAQRQQGKTPGEATGRAAVAVAYGTIGKQVGLTDKMLQAGLAAAEDKPVAEVPAFLEKYVTALASKGAVPREAPAAIAEAMHGAWNDAVDHTVTHLYPNQPQEPASDVAATDGAAAPAADQTAAAAPAAADPGAAGDGAPVQPVAEGDGQPGSQPVHAGAAPAADVAAAGQGDWQAFAPESGTLGVPRDEMPQIRAEHRGAMTNFMNARGVAHEHAELDPRELKPTQDGYSQEKVAQARDFGKADRSILVSSDGHVLDGHHQWLAKAEAGEPVKAIVLHAPIEQLIAHAREFPSAQTAHDQHDVQEVTSERLKDGTLLLKGPADEIRQTLVAAGIPERSLATTRDGVRVGRTQAGKVQAALDATQTPAREETAA